MDTKMALWKRPALLLFAIGWGANHFTVLLLLYRKSLGLDAAALAILFGVYALALVPGYLFSGVLSDRFGRRAVVVPAAVLALAATGLLAAGGQNFPTLLAGRLLYGLGGGAAMSPAAVWIIESSGEVAKGARRATIALSAGFGLGPLVSGVVAQLAPQPMIVPYVVSAAVLAIAIVLTSSTPSRAPQATTRSLLSLGIDPETARAFRRSVAGVAVFVFALPSLAFVTLPALHHRVAGTAAIGATVAFGLLAGVLVQPLTRRVPPTLAARIGLFAGAIAVTIGAVGVYHQLPWTIALATPVFGAAYGTSMTAGLRSVEAIATPSTRGSLTGLFYAVSCAGFLAPFAVAVTARVLTSAGALGLMAALALVLAALLRPLGSAPSVRTAAPVRS